VLICGHLHIKGEFRLGRTLVRQVHGVELLEFAPVSGLRLQKPTPVTGVVVWTQGA